MQKLLFITTGGTIACAPTDKGLSPSMSGMELLRHLPELENMCEAHTLPLFSIASTDMTPRHWLAIAAAIEKYYDDYDGFIVCHGTDTMSYTAAALSYLIQNSAKPIVLTGAQKPISFKITDAKRNLRDSVICATDASSHDVMLVFDGRIIAGTRAKKEKTYSFDAFVSVNYPALGNVTDDGIMWFIRPPEPCGEPIFYDELSTSVFWLKLTPGIEPDILPLIFDKYDCIAVESFGVGGVPQSIADKLEALFASYKKGEKLLVMATQVPYEGSNMAVYEVGRRFKDKLCFLEAHDMTPEAVYTKLMWTLAQTALTFEQKRDLFYAPVNFDTLKRGKSK